MVEYFPPLLKGEVKDFFSKAVAPVTCKLLIKAYLVIF
jgi:hypothetical protein